MQRQHIAIIIDLDWAFQHHHGVFVGTQRYAREHADWQCVVMPSLERGLKPRQKGRKFDGIIARATPEIADYARRRKIPLVNVQVNAPVKNIPTVGPDRVAVGRMAAEHLLARGFRQFAYVGYRQAKNINRPHLEGFHAALAAAGRDCPRANILTNYSQRKWSAFHDELHTWLRSIQPPVGIFVSLDLLCRYIVDVCTHANLRVPDDVALVGTQNEPVICGQPEPTLTSIDVGYERVGYVAAELLHRLMDGAKPPTSFVAVEPVGLIARQSTDVLAVDDLVVAAAMRFMSEHGHKNIHVDDIARSVATSRRSLERRFHDTLGRSIAQELNRLRFERIKRQLIDTETPLKVLALDSGFSDAKQLTKAFLRVEGLTPARYRRDHCQKNVNADIHRSG